MTRPPRYVVTNFRTGECLILTRAQLDRFFENRDPRDWSIR